MVAPRAELQGPEPESPGPSLFPGPVLGILIFGYSVLPLFDCDDGRSGLRSFFSIVPGNFLTLLCVIVYGILELDTDDLSTLQDFLLIVNDDNLTVISVSIDPILGFGHEALLEGPGIGVLAAGDRTFSVSVPTINPHNFHQRRRDQKLNLADMQRC